MYDFDISQVRNTRSMPLDPESPDSFVTMDKPNNTTMELLPVFTGQEFERAVAYKVIVEMWDKKNFGRHKRAWLTTFTQDERNTIASYYGWFYRWHLVSGPPERIACRLHTLQLLQRVVNFFGSIS